MSANKDLVRRIDEMVHHPELARELFSPDIAERQFVLAQQMHEAFPDIQIQVMRLIEEGDWLASRWTATGTQTGTFLGIAPTNARLTWTGTTMYRVEHGRVVETTTNWDAFAVIQQLHKAATR